MAVSTLLNLCDLYDNKVVDIVKSLLSNLSILDKAPVQGLPLLEDVIECHSMGEYEGVDSVHVSARIGDIMTDSFYNRGDNLRYGNQERDLNAMRGFSHRAAGTLVGFLRSGGITVATQGNNRISMLFAVTQDRSARISFLLNFHKPGISHDEIVRVEAENHNADCNFRSNQSTDEKFMSAYYSGAGWAKLIYNFLAPFGIGIAGTLEGAKFKCTSHGYIDKARSEAGGEFVKKFLDTHVKVFSSDNCEKEIFGNFVRGGSSFLSVFSAHIAEVDEKNGGIDSFVDMMNNYFSDREREALSTRKLLEESGASQRTIASVPVKKCLTQADITQGNRTIKGYTLFVCRFVSIYNEYCKDQALMFNQTYATAIPIVEGKTFANFIKKEDPILRPSFIDVASNPVVHKDS